MVKFKESIFITRLLLIKTRIKRFFKSEEKFETQRFCFHQGYEPDLKTPKTLNEKIAWLKIHYLRNFYYKACDKYLVHDYLRMRLGKDYAPPLLFVTKNPKELTFENIKVFPCIIKVSNGSGANLIVNSKTQYTEKFIQHFFEKSLIMTKVHTLISLEHQYDTESYIVVEKLLSDEKGGIPNDYKFLYINGQLEFIYCSVDRLKANVRQVYDSEWNRLHFAWVAGASEKVFKRYDSSESIQMPKDFEEMKRLSSIIAQDYPLVRVDFYEAKEGLFIGEITLHHGSGHDRFYPDEYDLFFGKKLVLPKRNR